MRRRSLAALVLGLAGCGSNPAHAPPRPPTALEREVGQMLMVGVAAGATTPAVRSLVSRGEVGGVVVYGQVLHPGAVRQAIAKLRALARAAGRPPLLVAVDQEGGEVKRIRGAPPRLDPQRMGAAAAPFATARTEGRRTGRALRGLGFDFDLAPVADVPVTRPAIASRYFGRDAATVTSGAAGFALGLRDAGVAAAAKHFPGLGSAAALQTDVIDQTVPDGTRALRASLAPYRRMAALGVAPVVMMSSAAYPALDPSGRPAVLSRRIVGGELCRAGLGDRVVMTDDLTTRGLTGGRPAPAVAAARAGDDLLLLAAAPGQVISARKALLAAVAAGRLPRARVREASARIARLKAAL